MGSKFTKKRGEAAFTLIELMVSIGIVGVLASLSVFNLLEFRDRSEKAFVNETLHHAFTTLEVGVSEEELRNSSTFRSIYHSTTGPITDPDAPFIAPAYVPPSRRVLSQFWFDPACEVNCWKYFALIKACRKNANGTYYYRYRGAYDTVFYDTVMLETTTACP